MALKRKRSSPSALSRSTSTTNSTSCSTSPMPHPNDIQMSDTTTATTTSSSAPQYPPPDPSSPPHLDSRTRKRFRDNRPDEETVHANTYATLFAAAAAAARNPSPPPAAPARSAPPPQRQREREGSLHNHWNISTPPLAPAAPTPSCESRCEDCDASLASDADVRMGGVEGVGEEAGEFACGTCARRVCDRCAVVAIGVRRDCLGCKTRRGVTWVGGIGWCP